VESQQQDTSHTFAVKSHVQYPISEQQQKKMIIDENKYHYLPVLDGNVGKYTDTV